MIYDSVIMDICHYTLAKPIKCTTKTENPNIIMGFGYSYYISIELLILRNYPMNANINNRRNEEEATSGNSISYSILL